MKGLSHPVRAGLSEQPSPWDESSLLACIFWDVSSKKNPIILVIPCRIRCYKGKYSGFLSKCLLIDTLIVNSMIR